MGGTTCTALIASLVSLKFGAVQIALVHLSFNIIGILIWFPIPQVRKVPLSAAKLLGLYASFYRFVPIVYILVAFVCIPGICSLIGMTFDASIGGGVVLLLFVLALITVFELAWLIGYPPGNALCYMVLTKEQREQGKKELEKANAELMGMSLEDGESLEPAQGPASGNEPAQEGAQAV